MIVWMKLWRVTNLFQNAIESFRAADVKTDEHGVWVWVGERPHIVVVRRPWNKRKEPQRHSDSNWLLFEAVTQQHWHAQIHTHPGLCNRPHQCDPSSQFSPVNWCRNHSNCSPRDHAMSLQTHLKNQWWRNYPDSICHFLNRKSLASVL